MAALQGRGLLKYARLTRRKLILFALASAAINGVITASVGAWLAQTYATYQTRRQSIETIAHLVYERRTRAGMVASSIRRDADVDEVRHRKQAYDESYVDWNKNVMLNVFAIREVAGDLKFSGLEPVFEDHLVAAMADVDRCVTRAYDRRLANADGAEAKEVLKSCHMAELHQYVLDCGATFTNELYKLTQLKFIPFTNQFAETKAHAQEQIQKACVDAHPQFPPETAPAAVSSTAPTAPATPAANPASPAAATPEPAPTPSPPPGNP